jgi:hypothetical protein
LSELSGYNLFLNWFLIALLLLHLTGFLWIIFTTGFLDKRFTFNVDYNRTPVKTFKMHKIVCNICIRVARDSMGNSEKVFQNSWTIEGDVGVWMWVKYFKYIYENRIKLKLLKKGRWKVNLPKYIICMYWDITMKWHCTITKC